MPWVDRDWIPPFLAACTFAVCCGSEPLDECARRVTNSPLREIENEANARELLLEDCPSNLWLVGGRCRDGKRFLWSTTGFVAAQLFFDSSGRYLGFTAASDTSRLYCWPSELPCEDPIVEEFICGRPGYEQEVRRVFGEDSVEATGRF